MLRVACTAAAAVAAATVVTEGAVPQPRSSASTCASSCIRGARALRMRDAALRSWSTGTARTPQCSLFASALHSSTREAATASAAPSNPSAAAQAQTADASRNSQDLAAAEAQLRHVRDDVAALSEASVPTTAPVTMTTSDATGGGDGGDGGNTPEPEWPEPTLADLDRSIPQVDCEFIASLIRSRNLRRDEFLAKKEAVKQRVEELSKKSTPSVSEAVKMPLVGGLGVSWMSRLYGGGGDGEDGEGGLVATSAHAPIVASAAVLEQLSAAEKDLLHTTRPEYDDGFVLLDCRTVNEVTSWGIIEGAKVLPAHEMFEAFHATPDEFQHEYGFAKPRPDDIIICYCQFGPRSLMAAQILSWMGYLKVMHFRDGYYEWGKQYNLLLRRWMEHDKESGNELRRLATFRAGLELQREIAPEFNALPMQEVRKYLRDTTRSPGTLLVGEGLRLEAYKMVAQLTEGLAPTALPGVADDRDGVTLLGGSSSSGADASSPTSTAAEAAESSSTRTRRLGEQRLTDFLEQTTGLDPKKELRRPTASMNLGEAQATVLDSLAYKHELGAPPDAHTTPTSPRPRRN